MDPVLDEPDSLELTIREPTTTPTITADSLYPGEIVLDARTMTPRLSRLIRMGYEVGEIFSMISPKPPVRVRKWHELFVWIPVDSFPNDIDALIIVAKDSLRALNVKWSWDFWAVCQVRQNCPPELHDHKIVVPLLRDEFLKCVADSPLAVLSEEDLLEQWIPIRRNFEQQYRNSYRQAELALEGIKTFRQTLPYVDEVNPILCYRRFSVLCTESSDSVTRLGYLDIIESWLLNGLGWLKDSELPESCVV